MPCMCGDIQCPSCGPAQGNWRCPICRAWADDCCEHISEETGELLPEFEAQAAELDRLEAECDEAMVEEYAESERKWANEWSEEIAEERRMNWLEEEYDDPRD